MLDKEFKQLTTRELFHIDRIVKRKRKGEVLSDEEQMLHDRFLEDCLATEKKRKAMIPIIILLLIGALFRVLRHHI